MSARRDDDRSQLRLVAVLALGSFAIGTDTFVVAGVLRRLGADLHVSLVEAGQLVTVFAVTFGVLAPVLAAATARVARRTLLLGALALFAVANVGSALAPGFAVLLGTRVLAAAGAALYTPVAAAAAVTLVAPERRGRALAVVLGGTTAATVLGVPVGTYVGNAVGWQGSFGLVAALAGLALVVLAVRLPALPGPPIATLPARLAVLADRRVLAVIVTTVLLFLGGFTVYTYVGQVVAVNTGVTGTGLTWLLVVFGAFGVVGNTLGGRLTDRLGPDPVLLAGLLVFAAALLAVPVATRSVAGTVAVLAVWALSAWSLTVPQQHRLVAIAPQTAQVAIGLNSAAVFLGIGAAGAFGGLALGHVSAPELGYVGGAVVLVAWLVAAVQVVLARRAARSCATNAATSAV
ncbi:MAG: MFS transporter [Angustibacter sp.]